MRILKHLIFTALTTIALMFSASVLWAKEIPYICELTAHTRFGFIPPKMVIVLDQANGTAYVYDGMIAEVHGGPISAQVTQERQGKYRLNWELEGLEISNNSTTNTQSTVGFDLGTMKVTLISYVGGFANTNRGSGKCEILKK